MAIFHSNVSHYQRARCQSPTRPMALPAVTRRETLWLFRCAKDVPLTIAIASRNFCMVIGNNIFKFYTYIMSFVVDLFGIKGNKYEKMTILSMKVWFVCVPLEQCSKSVCHPLVLVCQYSFTKWMVINPFVFNSTTPKARYKLRSASYIIFFFLAPLTIAQSPIHRIEPTL